MYEPEQPDSLEAMLNNLPKREPSQMLDERVAATLKRTVDEPQAIPSARVRFLRSAVVAAMVLFTATLAVVFLPRLVGQSGTEVAPGDTGSNDHAARLPEHPLGPSIAPVAYHPEPIELTWARDVSRQTRYTPTGRPYQALVRELVEQQTWYEPDTGKTMQISVPREELIVTRQMTF